MNQFRIIRVNGCLAALLVAGCSGMGANSTANLPSATAQRSTIGVPSITTEAPLFRCPGNGFHVVPKAATIKVGQALYLNDSFQYQVYFVCYKDSEPASWTASGGSIQPLRGGRGAVFSAAEPGVYRVHARWGVFTAHATVTVTLP